MANIVATGNFIEVTLRQSLAGQTLLNILHYRVAGTGPGAILAGTVAGELETYWQGVGRLLTEWSDRVSNELEIRELRLQVISPIRQAYVSVPLSINGQLSAVALPPNLALSINKRTDRAGRDQHSTSHFGGLVAADVLLGSWTPSVIASWVQVADELIAPITLPSTGVELVPVILHRTAPPVVVVTTTDITSSTVSDTVRTMRRRSVRLGI